MQQVLNTNFILHETLKIQGDNPAKDKNLFEVYENDTAPLIEYYEQRNLVSKITRVVLFWSCPKVWSWSSQRFRATAKSLF